MIERENGSSFEAASEKLQQSFTTFIRRHEEEFSFDSTEYRVEPGRLFVSTREGESQQEEVSRTFYRNIGTEERPSFRIANSLTIQRSDPYTFLQMEANNQVNGSMEEFCIVLSENQIQSMTYDKTYKGHSLGVTYSPQQILSLQFTDEPEGNFYLKEKLDESSLSITSEMLRSKKPTPYFVNKERFVMLSGEETLHVIRFSPTLPIDELTLPKFINGERILHSFHLQPFLSPDRDSFLLPSTTDKWQKHSYSDYLAIDWTSY